MDNKANNNQFDINEMLGPLQGIADFANKFGKSAQTAVEEAKKQAFEKATPEQRIELEKQFSEIKIDGHFDEFQKSMEHLKSTIDKHKK